MNALNSINDQLRCNLLIYFRIIITILYFLNISIMLLNIIGIIYGIKISINKDEPHSHLTLTSYTKEDNFDSLNNSL